MIQPIPTKWRAHPDLGFFFAMSRNSSAQGGDNNGHSKPSRRFADHYQTSPLVSFHAGAPRFRVRKLRGLLFVTERTGCAWVPHHRTDKLPERAHGS